MMTQEEKRRLIARMDELSNECCGIALTCEVTRLKMHPNFESKSKVTEEELIKILDEGLERLGLLNLMKELRYLAEQLEHELIKPAPCEVIPFSPRTDPA